MSDLLKLDQPHAKAHCRDGSVWMLPVTAHDDLYACWTLGRAFWTSVGVYGERITIKLADITGLSLWDEAAIADAAHEHALRKAQAMIEGEE